MFVFPSEGIFEDVNFLKICGPGGCSVTLCRGEEVVGLCFVLSPFKQVKNPVEIRVKKRNTPRVGLPGCLCRARMDWVILVGPFLLRTFYDSVISETRNGSNLFANQGLNSSASRFCLSEIFCHSKLCVQLQVNILAVLFLRYRSAFPGTQRYLQITFAFRLTVGSNACKG